jgi:hypothetical protein
VGTLLTMRRDWSAPLVLFEGQGTPTAIGDSALVRLLRYDPRRDASLYVEVLDGIYRHHKGRMNIQNAETGGVALGEYGIEYPYQACLKSFSTN